MGADASLVNAAYRMGMSNVPGDYSVSFNKQYEGIVAASEARSKIFSSITSGYETVVGSALEAKQARDKKREAAFGKNYGKDIVDAEYERELGSNPENDLATNFLSGVAGEYADYYGQPNGTLNKGFFDLAHHIPDEIYGTIKKADNALFPSRKNKRKKADAYARLEKYKNRLIKTKALVKEKVALISGGMANLENLDPKLKVLVGQLLEPDTDLTQQGIRLYHRDSDDKIMVEFTGNRFESKYDYNKKISESGDSSGEKARDLKRTSGAKKYQKILDNLQVRIDAGRPLSEKEQVDYDEAKEKVGGKMVLSLEEIFGSVKGMQQDVEAGVIGVIDNASELAGKRDEKSRLFTVNDQDAKRTILKGVEDQIKGADVISDLSTRDILKTGSTYRQDVGNLLKNMDLAKLGVKDEGEPGFEDDLKDMDLKLSLVNRLTNPQTTSDIKFAEKSMRDYYGSIAISQFNTKRAELLAEEQKVQDDKNTQDGKINYGREVFVGDTRVYVNHDTTVDQSNQLKTKPKGAIINLADGAYEVVVPGKSYKSTDDGEIYNIDEVWDNNSMPGGLEWFKRKAKIETSEELEKDANPSLWQKTKNFFGGGGSNTNATLGKSFIRN